MEHLATTPFGARPVTAGLLAAETLRRARPSVPEADKWTLFRELCEARTAFERASRDDRSRRTAQQWINYVDSEIQRAELMSQELPTNTRPTELDQMLQEAEAATGGDS